MVRSRDNIVTFCRAGHETFNVSRARVLYVCCTRALVKIHSLLWRTLVTDMQQMCQDTHE